MNDKQPKPKDSIVNFRLPSSEAAAFKRLAKPLGGASSVLRRFVRRLIRRATRAA